jgi:hypothetical protein
MNDMSDLFWNASVQELKDGYIFEAAAGEFVCLICGERFAKGIVYPKDNVLYEAERFARLHMTDVHGSMFHWLLELDKKWTGLTDLQRKLLHYFQSGLSDQQIVKELDGGSTSTIRNHRFTMREKTKQAKIFLAVMELMEETTEQPRFVPIHRTATMVDERYALTEKENADILKALFPEGLDGPLLRFPKKEKRKIAVLRHLVKRFEAGNHYTEKEVNAVLKEAFADYVTIRRYLIEYGFMDREPDGSKYWVKR